MSGSIDRETRPEGVVLTQPPGAEQLLGEVRFAEIDPVFLMDLRGWLEGPLRGRTPQVVREVTIVLGELMTNAFRHAAPPFVVRLTVSRRRRGVRIEVDDGSTPATSRWPLGRGLLIVRDICREWGVEHRSDGKVVWAEIPGNGTR